MYSNSLTYPSLSDMLLLQCPQYRRTPLDVAERYSQEEAAGVLRRHEAKRGAELEEEFSLLLRSVGHRDTLVMDVTMTHNRYGRLANG